MFLRYPTSHVIRKNTESIFEDDSYDLIDGVESHPTNLSTTKSTGLGLGLGPDSGDLAHDGAQELLVRSTILKLDHLVEIPFKSVVGLAADQLTHSHALDTLYTRETHTRCAENKHRARAEVENNGTKR